MTLYYKERVAKTATVALKVNISLDNGLINSNLPGERAAGRLAMKGQPKKYNNDVILLQDYGIEARKAKERQGERTDLNDNIVENLPQSKTRDKVAERRAVEMLKDNPQADKGGDKKSKSFVPIGINENIDNIDNIQKTLAGRPCHSTANRNSDKPIDTTNFSVS